MAQAVIALVQSVKNTVYAVDGAGHRRLLKAGDAVYAGETVQTGRDGEVVLAPEGGKPFLLGTGRELLVDASMGGGELAADEGRISGDADAEAVLQALREGRDIASGLEATAAGLGGRGEASGHGFVRLLRIAEELGGGVISESGSGIRAEHAFGDAGANTAPANTPPTANPDAVSTDEDTPVTIAVLANDTDPEGDPLTVTGASVDPALGTVTVNPDGTLTFVPAPNTSGTVLITYTIGDGHGGTATGTVTVTIVAVDDASVVRPDAQIIDEDTVATGNVLGNDDDIDSSLSVTGFSIAGTNYAAGSTAVLPGIGTLVLHADGSYVFTPASDWNGVMPQAVYTLDTGASTTLDITVRPVDDATVAAPDSQVIDEDTVATGNVLANDSDIDSTLSVTGFSIAGTSYAAGSIAVLPGIGTLVLHADGSYVFTPEADWNGVMPQAVYTLDTGATSTLDITVRPVDDATVAAPDSQVIDEDTVATGNVLANDDDIDSSLSVTGFTIAGTSYAAGSIAVLAGIGTLVLHADGSYVFTPEADWNGVMPQAVYTLDTGATSTLDITVRPINDPPVARDDAATTEEDTPVTIAVLGNDSDPDADPLTVTGASVDPGQGTVSVNPDGTLTFLPAPNFHGTAVISYTISDGHGGTATATVTVIVNPVNDPAVIGGTDSGTVVEDDVLSVNGTLTLTDPDGPSTFRPQSVSDGDYGTFALNADGTWTYTLNNDNPVVQALAAADSLVRNFEVLAADGTRHTVTVTIRGADEPNHPPVASSTAIVVDEDQVGAALGLSAPTDADGDALTITVTGLPALGELRLADGTLVTVGMVLSAAQLTGLVYNAPAELASQTVTAFGYTVSDGSHTVNGQTQITVNPLNDAPVATPVGATGSEDPASPIAVLLQASDVDNGVASFVVDRLPAHGTLYLDAARTVAVNVGDVLSAGPGGQLTLYFQPELHWSGNTGFGFHAVDAAGAGSAGATAAITVSPVADVPGLSLLSPRGQVFFTDWDNAPNADPNTSQRVYDSPSGFDGWHLVTAEGSGNPGGVNAFEVWSSGDGMLNNLGTRTTVTGDGNWVELNNAGSSYAQTLGIERTISTEAGAVYSLDFDYAGRVGFSTSYTRIAVYLDGTLLGTFAGTSTTSGLNWQHLLAQFVGDGASHTLRIVTDASSFNTGGRGAMVDNLRLTEQLGVAAGNADGGLHTRIDLDRYIDTALVDQDGSESLSLRIAGLPAGARVFSASGEHVVSGGVVSLAAGELASAYVQLDAGYTGSLNLGVTAIATESDGSTAESAQQTLRLAVIATGSGVVLDPGPAAPIAPAAERAGEDLARHPGEPERLQRAGFKAEAEAEPRAAGEGEADEPAQPAPLPALLGEAEVFAWQLGESEASAPPLPGEPSGQGVVLGLADLLHEPGAHSLDAYLEPAGKGLAETAPTLPPELPGAAPDPVPAPDWAAGGLASEHQALQQLLEASQLRGEPLL